MKFPWLTKILLNVCSFCSDEFSLITLIFLYFFILLSPCGSLVLFMFFFSVVPLFTFIFFCLYLGCYHVVWCLWWRIIYILVLQEYCPWWRLLIFCSAFWDWISNWTCLPVSLGLIVRSSMALYRDITSLHARMRVLNLIVVNCCLFTRTLELNQD